MNYLLNAFSRLLSGAIIAGSLFLTAVVAHARTNDLYVDSVTMDDLKNIELNPGDPIRYTVSYGREAASGSEKHGEQVVRVSVYLSTDGDPENINNFLLDFFDDTFPKDATEADPRSQILTDRLPPNFTGTYFLIAKVRVTRGSADTAPADDFPSVIVTSAARVTIRPYDSATVSRISTSATGTESNELSESPSVSADGRYVVFQSEATNLVSSPSAPAGISQIYLRDTLTNEVKLISQLGGVAGNAESKFPVISSLGAVDPVAGSPRYYIAYQSAASNLISGTGSADTNQQTDIFLYDLANATTTLISVPTGAPAGQLGNGGSFLPSISGDGNLIAFESLASNLLGKGSNGVLLDTNSKSDIFVYNRTTKVVTAASTTSAGVMGNGDNTQARISEDGSTVVFRSYSGNLAVGAAAPLPRSEILAKTLSTGRVDRISVIREPLGTSTRTFTALNRDAFDPAVSSDGRFVAFASRATNTSAPNGDANDAGLSQVYVVNRAVEALPGVKLDPSIDYDNIGNTSLNLVSTGISPLDPLPGFADDESLAPVISGDGRYIGFRTEASDLQPTTVLRSDGRVFQTKSSGVIAVIPDNTGVTVDLPVVTIKDGGGSGATARAIVSDGEITGIVIENAGSGYSTTADPKLSVEISGGGGTGATATATIGTVDGVTDAISAITITNNGRDYASAQVVFTNGVGSGATAVAMVSADGGVIDVSILTPGFGYNPQFTKIDFSDPDAPGGGIKPEAVPVIENGKVYDVVIISQGSGYLVPPAVTISSTPVIPASAGQVTFDKGEISDVQILDTGSGYVSAPDVTIEITDSTGTNSYPARAIITDGLFDNAIQSYSDYNNSSDVYIRDTGLKSIVVTEGGSGYTDNILLDGFAITGGGGSGASALAVVENGAITRIDLINTGAGYLSAPAITLPDSPTGGTKAAASAILIEGSERVSISQYGQETIGLIGGFEVPSSRSITMSSNGRYMLFTSEASNNAGFIFGKSNQIPLDQNKKRDIFIVDRKLSQAVTPVRGTAPTVTISIDTRDLTFNSSRVISASAFDGGDVTISGDEQLAKDGVIKSIEIYANNLKIASNSAVGTGSTMILDAVYTAPQVAGPTQLYAVTVDGNGNRVYSTPQIINVVAPQTQRPSVTLSSSTSTLTVGGTFVLSAIATDPENSIYSVSFYSNGLLLFTDFLPPYQYSYTPTYSGEYKLTAIVSDNDPLLIPGQPGSSVRNDSLSNEIVLRVLPPPSPTINIISPTDPVNSASLGQPIFLELSATTTNPSASISSVQIKDNGKLLPGIAQRQGLTSSYRYTWYPTTAGLHTITAVATDSQQGTSESSSRDFNVNPIVGATPVVNIVSPAADSLPILTQDIVNFQVSASDVGGTIVSTVIYGNGARLGSATFNAANGYWELPVDASLLATGLYDFVAVSTDNDGNLVASPVRSLSVVISAPLVSIVTPTLASGANVVDTKVDQPLLFVVRAYTRDSFSRVSNVTLSANGTSIGQATRIGNSDQYSFTWLPTTTGVFQIVASASDTKGGGSQTSELNVRVTELVGTAPEVQVISPASSGGTNPVPASASLGSQVLFVANASDNTGVSSVNFYADGVLLPGVPTRQGTTNQWVLNATLSGAPFSAKGVGSYAITAIATDADRNQTQSAVVTLDVTAAVSGTAPTGSLSFPEAGRVLIRGQSVTLRAEANDADGTIASVGFYANGVLVPTTSTKAPFTADWTPALAGVYNLVIVITDSQGVSTVTSPVVVTVEQRIAPNVSLVSPSSAVTVTVGSSLPLQATATASNSRATISSVDFYYNGVKVADGRQIGSGSTWSATWTIGLQNAFVVDGKLTAIATDSNGLTTESSPGVNVTVSKPAAAPSVSLVEPSSAKSVTIGSDLPMSATATDSDGTIQAVIFIVDGFFVAEGQQVGSSSSYTATWRPTNPLYTPGIYKLKVVAFDDSGLFTESTEEVEIRLNDVVGVVPSVQVTSPAAGGQNQAVASAALGSQVYLSANASDNLLVTGVNFYADGVSIGAATRQGTTNQWVLNATLSGAPFSAKGVGSYAITAIATDADRNQTQSAVVTLNVTAAVSGTAPTVEAVFPSSGQTLTLGGALTLQAVATDTEGAIDSVAVYANGVLVGTTTSAPHAITWTPSLAGSYNIVYVVTDSQGATTVTTPATVVVRSVTGNAPVANMLFPVAGNNSYTNASTIPLAVNVIDSDQPAATAPSIVFYVDGSAIPAVPVRLGNSQSYYVEFSTSQLTTGIHTALAVVNDAAGNTSSSVTTFTVTQATGPSFNTKPSLTANGAAAITITAGDTFAYQLEASRTNGRLVKMDVFLNGVSSIETAGPNNLSQNPVTQAPFISTWYAGQYDGKTGAYALATDDQGNVMLSNLVEITRLENGEPTVAVISPVGATTLTFGQPIVMDIEAKATTAGDIIKSIQFLANSTDLSDTLVTRLPGTDIWRLSFLPSVHSTYAVNAIATTRGTSTVDPATGQPFERSKTSATRTFTVLPVVGIAPSITLTQPTSSSAGTGGTTTVVPATATSGSPILLIAQATAGGSSIDSVEFFARSGLGGTASLGKGSPFGTGNLYSVTAAPLAVGNYELFAVVTDLKGNMVQSNLTNLTVTASLTAAPSVTLSEPSPSAITLGQVSNLVATASSAVGTNIAKVDFYANGSLVGTAATAPYVFAFTASATGVYELFANVTDSAGNAWVSQSRRLTVNALVGTAPRVTLTDTTAVKLASRSKLPLTAVVTLGNSPVSSVQFFANNINGGAATLLGAGAPVTGSTTYQLVYTNTLAAGDYTVYAVVTDTNGNIVQSATRSVTSVAVTAPTVRIISPTAGAYNILDGTTFAAASARVTTRPATNPTFNGDQDITGVVIEDEGLNYDADVTAYIEVRNDPAFGGGVARTESLTVTLGANGIISGLAIASGGNARLFFYQSAVVVIEDNFNIPALTVVTSATAASGVEIVRLYANGVLIGSKASAPYTFAWSPSRAGTYQLHAEVTDSDGITASSDPLTIVINQADDVAPVETLAAIENAYQAVFGRSPTNEETVSAVDRFGVALSSGQVAALLLQSSDFRDDQGELILSHLAVWGEYPTASQYAVLETQREFNLTDVQIVDALLASVSYKERYGDIADLNTVNSNQYNRIRALALRTYRNLYGKDPSNSATANAVAKQFFYNIATLLQTPGQAVVNFTNENFAGGKSGTTLTRLRMAGAILLIGNEQPTKARIDAFAGLPLAAVADYYFDGGAPFSAGTVVSIETAEGTEAAGTTYYASGLPKGLTIDRTTGVISGRLPSTAKAYAITFWTQVNGVRGATATRVLVVEPLDSKFVGTNDVLLLDADGLPAGKLSVKVAGTASYTGTLIYRDGRSYSFKGVLSVLFDEDGESTAYGEQSPIKRKAPLSALQIGLFFDADGRLSASVTEGDDIDPIAEGEAIRVFTFTKSAPAPWQGTRAVNLTDISAETFFLDGAGSGTLKVANTGVLSVSLKGADGAKITGSASSSIASEYRLYSRPYSKKPEGYFAGSIKFSDEATPALVEFPADDNDLTWFRPAGLAPYGEGFGPLKIQLDYD